MDCKPSGHYDEAIKNALNNTKGHIEKSDIKKKIRAEENKIKSAENEVYLRGLNNIRKLHESVANDGVPEIHLIVEPHPKARTKREMAIERAKLYAVEQVLKYNTKAYKDHLHKGLKDEYVNIFPGYNK